MEPDELNQKRKRLESIPSASGRWLLPGDREGWRDNKKARSVSGSRSPSPAGTSTPNEAGSNEPIPLKRSSLGLAKLLSRSQGCSRANDTSPSLQECHNMPQAPSVNIIPPVPITTSTVRSGLEEAFRKLRIVTDVICPSFCSVIDDLTACLHVFETAARNRQEYNDLTDELKSLVEQLIRHLHAAPTEDTVDSISNISEAMRKEIDSIGARQARSGIRRVLDGSGDDQDLHRRYRRIKQLFQQILGEASMSTWNITNEHFVNTQLESLHPAKLARFDSSLSTDINRRTCTENTRTMILEAGLAWSEEPSGAKIYWMNGMAGTGKTTIATTLSTTLEARKQLAASFFCTRTSPECRKAKRIVPTIAYQFARRSTPFRSALSKALKEDPDISTGNITSQFELLLRRPLMKVKDKLPNNLVVVVDALDECDDTHVVELFLNFLIGSIMDLPIKFYVSSRPEPGIRNRMMLEGERTRSILYLHEIEKSLVQADIELYLRQELSFMTPSELEVKRLAEHAANLFIYAATAVRYIHPTGRAVNSQARLSTILAVDTESKKKLSGLDALYTAILEAAIDNQDLESKEQESTRLVLWTVICACEPILIGAISALCGVDKNSTTNALESLRSVLHVSDQSGLVTTLHASFPDYLLAQDRSGVFFCDKATHSRLLTQQCFKIMQAQLRFNIGSITSSFIPDKEIPDLKNRLAANISKELFYACRFWADHLSQAHPTDNLGVVSYGFLSKHLLFWMEVLNLKQCATVGVGCITKLTKWLLQNSNDPGACSHLSELASSASRFIINYLSSPASAYTPHIYLSLLAFTASSGPLRLCYMSRFKGLVKASGTRAERLGESNILSKWESKIEPQCASFSPNLDLIVWGSETGEISVQSVYNGSYLVKPFKAHKSSVRCLDISENGMRIVSSSTDGILYVWSAQDGSLISGPCKGHIKQILVLRFSSNNADIASGSDDCTVRVWNSSNATLPMRSFAGHTNGVNSVDFSPDGLRIVSSSYDHTIRVWDLYSGATIFTLQDSTWYTLVRFTPGSTQIISASQYSDALTLRARDESDGSLLHSSTIEGHHNWAIALSPEGDRVATESLHSHAIHIRNRHTGNVIGGPFKRSAGIISTAFSDDGLRIASVLRDKTVQMWDAYNLTKQAENHSQRITGARIKRYFVLAPNRARVAEIYAYGINIWDMDTATLITSIWTIRDYSWGVNFIQFSLDGTRIFAVESSVEIFIWNTDTGELVHGPQSCSQASIDIHDPQLVACSADGTRVATYYGETYEIELWDAQLHRHIAYLKPNECDGELHHFYRKIMFARSNKRLITQTTYLDLQTTIYVWDADSGERLAGPFFAEELYDISPNGTTILCSMRTPYRTRERPLHLINVCNKETTCLPDMPCSQSRFSPDGLYVLSCSPIECCIWDIRKGTITAIKPLPIGYLGSFLYSPDGWCETYGNSLETMNKYQVYRFRVNQPFHITTIDSDGWLRDNESRPLIWLPREIRNEFPRDSRFHMRIENGESFCVDYRNIFVGDEWSKCYIGD